MQPYATGFYRIEGQGEAQRLAEEALQLNGVPVAAYRRPGIGHGIDQEGLHSDAAYEIVLDGWTSRAAPSRCASPIPPPA